MKISEIKCSSALSKCGFEEDSYCINPYLGCGHACVYCYARFMKRFTGHKDEWGSFVDAKINIADVLEKQLRSGRYKGKLIFIGTVCDPYQPAEKKYKLMRKILPVLIKYQNPIEILTKSDLILRDLDLLKQLKDVCINFTVNTLDEKWKKLVEPNSSSVKERLKAARKLRAGGIKISFLMGPYWPFFTDAEALFREFKKAGASHLFTESFNTIGGNFSGVEKVMKGHYPRLLPKIKEILFNPDNFSRFYSEAEGEVKELSKKYHIPITIFFARGHAKNK